MLPRKNLISLKKEFPRLRQQGKIYNSDSFSLIVSYGSSSLPQAAFVVSKKVSTKSVIRHAAKRKLADAVAPYLIHLPRKTQLVFLAKQKAIDVSQKDLQKETEGILKRTKLL